MSGFSTDFSFCFNRRLKISKDLLIAPGFNSSELKKKCSECPVLATVYGIFNNSTALIIMIKNIIIYDIIIF